MTSALASALEVRGIPALGQITTEIETDFEEVERDRSVLTQLSKFGKPVRVLSAVRLHYRLTIPPGKREEAEQALETHDRVCAATLTLRRGVDVSCTWDIHITAKSPVT